MAQEQQARSLVRLEDTRFEPWTALGAFERETGLDDGRTGAASVFVGTMRDFNVGDDVEQWREVVADGLQLYGKAEARPGRKMGHVNRVTRSAS